MPWIPELASAAELARRYKATRVPFYEGVMHASPQDLLGSWGGEPRLDDPRLGRVVDREGFEEWVRSTQRWLLEHGAQLRPVDVIKTPERTKPEGLRRRTPIRLLLSPVDGTLPLPSLLRRPRLARPPTIRALR